MAVLTPYSKTGAIDLERAVRPFVNLGPGPARTRVALPADPTTEDPIPSISFIALVPTNIIPLSNLYNIILDEDPEENRETSRTVTVERVTSSEDPEQFVDVERTESATFRDARTRQQRTFRFNNG